MSIDKRDRRQEDPTDYDVTCDSGISKHCVGELGFDDENFVDVSARIRFDGWQVFKDKFEKWNHVCPACKEQKKVDATERLKKELESGR